MAIRTSALTIVLCSKTNLNWPRGYKIYIAIIVSILTFMSRQNSILDLSELEKC